jgi:hypothetical protein
LVFNLDKLSMFLLCSIEGKCEEHKGMMGSLTVLRSPERLGFALFLRKGARLPRNTLSARGAPIEKKFNPYHDSQNGQFTFGPGGGSVSDGVYRPDEGKPSLIRTGAEGPSRGIGDNAPPLDAITLAQAFPGLINAPAGAVIAVADPIFDLTAPGGQLTSDLSLASDSADSGDRSNLSIRLTWFPKYARWPDADDQRSTLGPGSGDLQGNRRRGAATGGNYAVFTGSSRRRI